MEEQYHIEMTHRALGDRFSSRALDIITEANIAQDSLKNLLHGEFHFDGNRFADSFLYVEQQTTLIFDGLRTNSSPIESWMALGRLIHSLQDFYSHTNYVALWRSRFSEGEIDPVESSILGSEQLIAAWVYYPLEALTYFKSLRPLMRRVLPADSHANMNLDSPGRGPLFEDAIQAAEGRTKVETGKIMKKIMDLQGEPALRRFLDRGPALNQ